MPHCGRPTTGNETAAEMRIAGRLRTAKFRRTRGLGRTGFGRNGNQWARLLAHVTGLVNQELLLQNEYLAAENRILRAHLPASLHLSHPERRTLLRLESDSGAKLWRRWPAWPNQTPSSPGTGGSLPASSMVPNAVRILADPVFQPWWSNWWFVLPARIRVGGTTALSARWPTWVIIFRIRPWATFCAATTSHQLPSGVRRRLGRSSSGGTWTCSQEPTSSRSRC